MTDSSTTKNAWPNRQYGGNSEQYEDYETEMEAWAINNSYEEHLNGKAPERADFTGARAQARFEAALAGDAKDKHGQSQRCVKKMCEMGCVWNFISKQHARAVFQAHIGHDSENEQAVQGNGM